MFFRTRFAFLTAVALSLTLVGAPLAQAQGGLEGTQDVLTQLDNAYPPDTGNILSSRFELVPGSDKIAADDLIVPAGLNWWWVTGMAFIGNMCLDSGMGDQVWMVFYNNSGDTDNGKPGTVFAQSIATVAEGTAGNCAGQITNVTYHLTPQSTVWLRSGAKYWVSIHSIAPGDNPFARRLYWAGRSGVYTLTQPAFYYSGGSLTACNREWVERRVCDGTTLGDDMTWSMTYTPFQAKLVYLPVLSRQ